MAWRVLDFLVTRRFRIGASNGDRSDKEKSVVSVCVVVLRKGVHATGVPADNDSFVLGNPSSVANAPVCPEGVRNEEVTLVVTVAVAVAIVAIE